MQIIEDYATKVEVCLSDKGEICLVLITVIFFYYIYVSLLGKCLGLTSSFLVGKIYDSILEVFF